MQGGWPALLARVTGWSPRPLSESILFGYFHLVERTGRQLIAPFLGALWAIFLVPLALFLVRLGWSDLHRSALALVCALSAPLLFLTNTFAYDVFFWVQGAAAYLPTLFAILIVLVALGFAGPFTTSTRLLVASALLVATLSSELGAFFVVFFSSLIVAQAILSRVRPNYLAAPDLTIPYALPPLLAGCAVIFGMYSYRLGDRQEIFGNPNIAQHPVASLTASLQTFPLEFIGTRPVATLLELVVYGPLPRAFFALGIATAAAGFGLALSKSRNVTLLAFAAAALGAAFLSTFASFYQFGNDCCGRHQVMRESFGAMAIFALAIAASPLLARTVAARSRFLECLGLALIVFAVLLASIPNWPAVKRSYARFDQVRATMASNWQSGRSDSPRFVYILRGDSYSGDPALGPGVTARSDVNLVTGRMLDFFRKKEIEILPPLP
jgi:hypothetical protein